MVKYHKQKYTEVPMQPHQMCYLILSIFLFYWLLKLQMADKVKRSTIISKLEHHFHIRKVPLKKFVPQKTPQLYALDVHSICLPIQKKKSLNWASIHCQYPPNFEQEFNQQIIYSQSYQQLYSHYMKLKQQRNKEKAQLHAELQPIEEEIQRNHQDKKRLISIRDKITTDIQSLKEKLTDWRDTNYNLRWELYHQRGAYSNGYVYMDGNQMTYQQLLQMEEQMGSVNRGLTIQEIDLLPKQIYQNQSQNDKQICCVCYDQIEGGQWVTILKCKHVHHCECIKDWLVKQKLCPICKKQVTLNDILQ